MLLRQQIILYILVFLCAGISQALAATGSQEVKRQRALNFTLRGLDDALYNSGKFDPTTSGGEQGKALMPHSDFYKALSAVSPVQMDSTVPQLLGTHAPTMNAESKTPRTCDPSKFPDGNQMEYADGGSKVFGPCCGDRGSQAGLKPYYFERFPEADGTGQPITDKYREILPKTKSCTLSNPVGYCAAREAIKMNRKTPNEISLAERMKLDVARQQLLDDMKFEALSNFQKSQAALGGACEGASEAVSDSFDSTWPKMLALSATPCPNVGNERTGQKCLASQPIKTHENALYLVQEVYKLVYLPIALLLLLPGAVLTSMKGLVSHSISNSSNDDGASPFTGILRSLVAIFLIPASQLIVSYTIDVGNALQGEIATRINYKTLQGYGDEQVFRAPMSNFSGGLLPPRSGKVQGKITQGPEDKAELFNVDPASIMLQTMANAMSQSAAFGLVILCAFQIVLVSYLFLMGPVAAAFYAWPGSVGSLFTRVFTSWLDAMINVALWRFWWCVVLLIMDSRLTWLGAGLEMYSMWELLMFISFLVIMTSVPFNPFDFRAGDMIQQIMAKSEEAVDKASKK
ncbi:MAG: hypothetical protein K2X93_23280 [Candidatus Obscuribacterales bacterium]|nr:hypothetical protein [Candidatus Obscuribacterales bacterium]